MGRKIKRLLLDMASFNSPQALVINFTLIFIIAIFVPTSKLHYLPVRSVYETVFHLTPYSSGLTRGMSRLFHGDLIGAWSFNKLTFLVALVMAGLLIVNLIRSIKQYKKTGKIY